MEQFGKRLTSLLGLVPGSTPIEHAPLAWAMQGMAAPTHQGAEWGRRARDRIYGPAAMTALHPAQEQAYQVLLETDPTMRMARGEEWAEVTPGVDAFNGLLLAAAGVGATLMAGDRGGRLRLWHIPFDELSGTPFQGMQRAAYDAVIHEAFSAGKGITPRVLAQYPELYTTPHPEANYPIGYMMNELPPELLPVGPPPTVLNFLNLFEGKGAERTGLTGIFRERGHNVHGVEINPALNPTSVGDVRNLTSKDLPFKPDVVWASPPCTEFSGCKTRGLRSTARQEPDMSLVLHTKRLLDEINPRHWIVENTVGAIPALKEVFGEHRARFGPFVLWGNFPVPSVDIKPFKQYLSSGASQLRGRIPSKLSAAIMTAIENDWGR